jgi:formylglycine-generating enzyme required for sulfatase activity
MSKRAIAMMPANDQSDSNQPATFDFLTNLQKDLELYDLSGVIQRLAQRTGLPPSRLALIALDDPSKWARLVKGTETRPLAPEKIDSLLEGLTVEPNLSASFSDDELAIWRRALTVSAHAHQVVSNLRSKRQTESKILPESLLPKLETEQRQYFYKFYDETGGALPAMLPLVGSLLPRLLKKRTDDDRKDLPVHTRVVSTPAGNLSIPVRTEQWQEEIEQLTTQFGVQTKKAEVASYWCYVRRGNYRIGGWEKGQPAVAMTLKGFWIACVPVTVAQFAPFVEVGYTAGAERWWTAAGWKWKVSERHMRPWRWDEPPYNGANLPVSNISWYEAAAWAAWLTDQLIGLLPKDYVVRLPTEAEWEVAASYDAGMQRHIYPWGNDEPTPKRTVYDASGFRYPAPIGTCPTGAAACGALDMVGNIWEWMTSSFKDYPQRSVIRVDDFEQSQQDKASNVPERGGSWLDDAISVRCSTRNRVQAANLHINDGFRVVVAPIRY